LRENAKWKLAAEHGIPLDGRQVLEDWGCGRFAWSRDGISISSSLSL
jgi:hypothetical protein